jgi:predicted alpha/beta-hydrolase family hydrolase
MLPHHIINGPKEASLSIALAHGAGAPMDSHFMTSFSESLGAEGFRVLRFEFPYMTKQRITRRKIPPDRTPVLINAWREVIAMMGPENLVIGGKSLGGRMASMIADEARVRGLVCLGYPFHVPGKLIKSERTAHLKHLQTPSLFCQGTRDNLGNKEDVKNYNLSRSIILHWLEDGDHSFKPRKASGLTEYGNWQNAIEKIIKFLRTL